MAEIIAFRPRQKTGAELALVYLRNVAANVRCVRSAVTTRGCEGTFRIGSGAPFTLSTKPPMRIFPGTLTALAKSVAEGIAAGVERTGRFEIRAYFDAEVAAGAALMSAMDRWATTNEQGRALQQEAVEARFAREIATYLAAVWQGQAATRAVG